MKSLRQIGCLVSGLLLITACNSPDAPDCLKSAGDPAIEERVLEGEITEIELHDLVDLVLSDRGGDTISISGPANLLKDISTDLESGKLLIQNHNTCNWVRNLNRRVEVQVPISHLQKIAYWGQGDIIAEDTLRGSKFSLDSFHGSGDLDLTLEVDTLRITIQTGVAGIDLKGKAKWFEAFHQGYGVFDAHSLDCDLILANSNSINNMHLHVNNYLFAYIQSKGNIYYSGNPDQIDVEQPGTGSLIEE